MKTFFKKLGIITVGLVLVLALGIYLFTSYYPAFGASPTKEQKAIYAKSGHFSKGIFHNLQTTNMDMDLKEILKLIPEFFKKGTDREPKVNLPTQSIDSLAIQNHLGKATQITWFGHSAFLLEMDSLKILLDPMLGEVPSPITFLGKKRYSKDLPISIEKLPEIDLVIFSHDHYDHLDYGTIQKIKDKTKQFFVPLAVGNHLEKWGVPKEKIREFNWWESGQYQNLEFVFTPSRHFSGRGVNNRFSTLWGSWVIKGKTENLYFSGDSGYGEHFAAIGKKYGPFDLAMMECGQYNEKWKEIHMMPEETIQASIDLGAKKVIPIHWGAFTLALHSWTEPIERAEKEAKRKNIPLITPKIGEVINFQSGNWPTELWWRAYL